MKKQTLTDIFAVLIIMMFLYASFSKYFNWPAFQRSMYIQPFSHAFAWVLMILVPPLEILAAVLLMMAKRRYLGFLLSAVLMAIFTGYISLILLGFFPKVPCSCGGILKSLGWKQHLIFNIFFLLISMAGTAFENQYKETIKSAVNAA